MLLRREIYIALAVLIPVACAESEPDPMSFPVAEAIDPGFLDGHVYVNHFFNFRIELPEEWYILSRPEADQFFDVAQASFPADDPVGKTLATVERNSGHLLMAMSAPPGAPVFGARISIRAEAIDCDPATCTAADYLDRMRSEFAGSTVVRMEFGLIEHDHKLGSLAADMLAGSLSDEPGALNEGFGTVHQRHYATRVKDYMLLIMIAYTDDVELATLLESLRSIKPANASN